jgi:hypothetical protein
MAKGYLVVTVAEATGKNKDDVVVWDPSFVEGFVKGREHARRKKRLCRAIDRSTGKD